MRRIETMSPEIKASELINRLQEMISIHGDLTISVEDFDGGSSAHDISVSHSYAPPGTPTTGKGWNHILISHDMDQWSERLPVEPIE